jgi:hypothetical protein
VIHELMALGLMDPLVAEGPEVRRHVEQPKHACWSVEFDDKNLTDLQTYLNC